MEERARGWKLQVARSRWSRHLSVWEGKKAFTKSPQGWGPVGGQAGWKRWVASKGPVGEALRCLFSAPRVACREKMSMFIILRLLRKQRRPREAVQVGQAG